MENKNKKMKEIEIAMVVNAPDITEDEVSDKFVKWVEENNWSCGGKIEDVTERNKLPSRFQIGDEVIVNGRNAKITAVKFTKSKVYYSVDDDSLSLALYDSLDVKPINKS
jgi:hypothetical protein